MLGRYVGKGNTRNNIHTCKNATQSVVSLTPLLVLTVKGPVCQYEPSGRLIIAKNFIRLLV